MQVCSALQTDNHASTSGQTCQLSYYLLGKILPEIFPGIFFTASNDETLTDPDGSKQLSELADER